MGWFESQNVQGYTPSADAPPPSNPSYYPTVNGAAGQSQGMGDYGGDPFGYTGGSLLTPWTQQFVAPPGSSGGYSAPAYTPFNYADFGYSFNAPGAYGGQQDLAPASNFQYGNFSGAPAFTGVSAQDLQNDQSYQFRLQQGQAALENSAAAKGLLRSGATAQDLMNYGQGAASQEYQNVYARKAAEHDRAQAEAQAGYGLNRGNAAENFDRNVRNEQTVNAANNASRLAAYQANSDVALRGGELGFNIATGTYDRNYAKARTGYEDAQSAANAAASAGSANANQAYNRALDEYRMNYDIFQNNQSNQYNRLMGLTGVGMQASGAQAGYGSQYAGNMGDLYTGQGANNAQAAASQGQAWGNMAGGIGQGLAAGYANYQYGKNNGDLVWK